ncbi:glycoside hydrolase family 13 protein [Paenibacillus sp. URB8-2]|uniref:glycoside hydrolase family 13 protein n=1 Tax=Paenibacillus sp. URB8-2 TaxID=2741301 RepID=UPI0015BDFD22|nr:alpha-glucosidase [Paenibacillus sp. URB8-2]BCG60370.1 oligo-1,6-glucosidase [Paenibacillus sp. URB8-2]
MEKKWWKEAVFYQIYPRSFQDSNGDGVGDLKGITSRLDYLQELGIDVIWLSPVYQSPNDDNGYDISDYRNIMKEFGTMADFDEMLDAAHERGIKIMMDLVVNHSSDEHNWFMESRSSKDSPYRDYYIWRSSREGKEPNNWASFFGGSAWEIDPATGEYYMHLFSRKQPDLNWENPALRNEIYEMMTWWLDKGVDGFRMDVINFISKVPLLPDGEIPKGLVYGNGVPYFVNGPRIHEFLQEMNSSVLSRYDLVTVGEMPVVDIEEAMLYTGDERNELNMVFHFDHVNLGYGEYGRWSVEDWKLTELKTIFSKWQYGLEEKGWNSLYWSNHDQPRAVSNFGNDSEEYRVISAKMLAVCLHMLKGSPYIYQGEELGMTNVHFHSIEDYRDIETVNGYRDFCGSGLIAHDAMLNAIHHRSRDNARTPMQWNGEPNGGFTTGTPWIEVNPNYTAINAENVLADPNSIFYFYQQLIQLRKDNDIVVYGKYDLILEKHEEIYAYTRAWNDEKWLVICNFSDSTPLFQLPVSLASYTSAAWVIGNYPESVRNIASFQLRPYEALVFSLRQ